jgi:hypothetical protein
MKAFKNDDAMTPAAQDGNDWFGAMPRLKFLLILLPLVLLPIVGLTAGVILVQQSTKVCNEARWPWSAYSMMVEVVADYAAANGGRWPSSWDDLLRIPNKGVPGFHWPADFERVKKRISINFNVTTDDVISAGSEHFTAIKQIGPNFGPDSGLEDILIESLRNAVARAKDAPRPNKGWDRAVDGR